MAAAVQIPPVTMGAPPQNFRGFQTGNPGTRPGYAKRGQGSWPQPNLRECFYCRRQGHLVEACKTKAYHEQQKQQRFENKKGRRHKTPRDRIWRTSLLSTKHRVIRTYHTLRARFRSWRDSRPSTIDDAPTNPVMLAGLRLPNLDVY